MRHATAFWRPGYARQQRDERKSKRPPAAAKNTKWRRNREERRQAGYQQREPNKMRGDHERPVVAAR